MQEPGRRAARHGSLCCPHGTGLSLLPFFPSLPVLLHGRLRCLHRLPLHPHRLVLGHREPRERMEEGQQVSSALSRGGEEAETGVRVRVSGCGRGGSASCKRRARPRKVAGAPSAPLSPPGHLIGPVLCHSFCNYMGFPAVCAALEHPQRWLLLAGYALGVGLFLLLLQPLTDPKLYGSLPLCVLLQRAGSTELPLCS